MTSSLLLLIFGFLPGFESIDRFVESAAKRDQVQLTTRVGDELFLRRISLDLIGRIPTRRELQDFRQKPDRSAAVRSMLTSQEHHQFWSRIWTSTLVGYGQSPQADRESLRGWLEEQFAADRPLDSTIHRLISAEGRSAFDGPANFMLRHARDPVVPIGRIFLGVQLDCARCHDHPTDRWTQEDFRGMEQFFALVQPKQISPSNYEVHDRRPNNENKPTFLTGTQPRTGRWRQELALLVTSSKPFGRSMANRLWYHFFGHGIKNPPDAVNGGQESDDIELIRYLADRLHDDGFRPASLIEEICLSNSYQRMISATDPDWPLLPTAKPMTPDQLFDSLHIALGEPVLERRREAFTRAATSASLDVPFDNSWESQERVQALMTRMNMPLPTKVVSTVGLFERTLSRGPTRKQLDLCENQSTQDILFALVNSNEFYFWH